MEVQKNAKVVYSSGRFGISRSRKKWIISIKRGKENKESTLFYKE